MTKGYDINSRPDTTDVGPLMLQVWKERCSAATIFFDVFHEDISQRPRGVHLAIYFSSADVLKLLVANQVNLFINSLFLI